MNIAITQRIDFINGRGEYRDAVDQRLISLIATLGHCPIPVPNCLPEQKLKNWIKNLDIGGIVFSGGNDIGEFGIRDTTERVIFEIANNEQMPIFGICRGMQFINIMHNGSLKPVVGHAGTYHEVISQHTFETFVRNSFHNFGVDNLGDNLEVTFVSQDGQIEGVKHKYQNHHGIMWHPERESKIDPEDIELLKECLM